MIFAVAWSRLWNLRHDRAALVLSYVLPIVFFTIFGAIFGGDSGRSVTRKIRVAVVNEDDSENAKRFVAALKTETGLAALEAPETKDGKAAPFTAASAEAAVKNGDFSVALLVPKGFGDRPIRFGPSGDKPKLTILSDPSDPVAPPVLAGLAQKVLMTAMPDAMARSGMEAFDKWGGGLTPDQRAKMDENLKWLRENPAPAASPAAGASSLGETGLVDIERRDVLGDKKKKNPMIAFYAAGLGVMFLLFSAAGAGGALIEEAESGTLDRILSTHVSMGRLLGGKLLYLACLAASQLLVMFLWGWLVFGLEMRGHWIGFTLMTIATALAASTFGLLLAAVSRSRMQLVAISNLAVLVMSAVGGSMFPRFLMPEAMQKFGLVTINAWAIDGFQKVFWREEPVTHLWPQLSVLCAIAVVFFILARRVARRWEVA
jgi:ABC-2 type transport system permease protein